MAAWVAGELVALLVLSQVAGCGLAGGDTSMFDGTEDTDVSPDAATDMVPLDDIGGDTSYGPEDWELDCVSCGSDDECDDGLTCSGPPQCAFSQYNVASCCRPQPVECPSTDPCVTGRCTEETGGCVFSPRDDDGDGHGTIACGHDDCDDSRYSVHPGARELCDGLDNDCDGVADEDAWAPSGEALELSEALEVPTSPSLAASTTVWAVAWIASTTAGGAMHAGVVTPADPSPTTATGPVALDAGEPVEVVVVATTDGFAIIASVPGLAGSTSLVARAMDASGVVGDTEHILVALDGDTLDLAGASSGDRVGLAFRSDIGGDYEVYFLPLDWPAPATVTDADLVRVTSASGFSGRPSLVGTADGWAVAWEDARDGNTEIYFALLDAAGTPAGPARRITAAPGDSQNASLMAGGDGFGLAWMDSRGGGHDLMFTCLDATGVRKCPELTVEDGPVASWYPALAPSGIDGQLTLAFAGRTDDLFHVHLTAVATGGDVGTVGIDPGVSLDPGAVTILDPVVAGAADRRAIMWIDDSPGTGTLLKLQQMVCPVED